MGNVAQSRKVTIRRVSNPFTGLDSLVLWTGDDDQEPITIPGTTVSKGQPINRTLAIREAIKAGWINESDEVVS